MTGPYENPAVEWFISSFGEELIVAQVRIARKEPGRFELRHVDDEHKPAGELKIFSPREAREVARSTESGAFRPLKSAPTLRRGWRITAAGNEELATALDRLYPGAIADLFATRNAPGPSTDYPEFTDRQTGMYRITAFLKEREAGAVVQKCCAPQRCLKRRFWNVAGFAPEEPRSKSVIPCLEPCAILLEFARKVVRATQRGNQTVEAVLPNVEPASDPEDAP